MQRVMAGDVAALARHLVTIPEDIWRPRIKEVVDYATYAYEYKEQTGKAHRQYGTGSIMAASSGLEKTPHEPSFSDGLYRRAWIAILAYLEVPDKNDR